MKKISLIIAMILGALVFAFAQTFPQGMNYQAVVRDLDGQVMANQEIGLKVTLLCGTPEGKVVYSEVHQVATNPFGLINLVIGYGDVLSGDMFEIPWANEEIWMDIALGNDDKTYTSISTTRLLAVPYAFHALSADRVGVVGGDEKVTSPYWKTLGNSGATANNFLGTTDFKDLHFKTNNTKRMTILASGNVEMTYDLVVDGTVTAAAYLGDGSGLTGIDVRDADHDPTNELQKWPNIPGIPAELLDGDDVDDADADPTNELQTWQTLPGIPGYLLDGDDVNDADADPTNELQTWQTLPGIPGYLLDGDDVDDADADPTNELELPAGGTPGQILSISQSGKYIWIDAEPTYSIGFNARLGGFVFYVTPDGKHGLVAAMQDQGYTTWLKCQDEISKPANHDVDGKKFTNWRLPTLHEINLMHPYKLQLAMYNDYWCSLEQNYFDAWYKNFWYGYQGFYNKTNSLYVRAVRDF